MRLPPGARPGVAPLSVLSSVAWACSSSNEPAVMVSALMPSQAFNDATIDGLIMGGPFRPAYDIDTVGGAAMTQSGAFSGVLSPASGMGPSYALGQVTWASSTSLA